MNNLTSTRIVRDDIRKRFNVINNHVNSETQFFHMASEFLKYVKDNELLSRLLQEIISDKCYLSEIAAQSYRHVNHFSKIVLINEADPTRCRLTLHIWKPPFSDKEKAQELIHDHRFSFASYIVCGKQEHQIFSEVEKESITKKIFQKYKYYPSKTGNIHDCYFDKDVQLNEKNNMIVNKGDIYTMENVTIHRIMFPIEEKPIISFLVRGPRKRIFTHTYNTFYPREGTSSNVPMYTTDELDELLKYTLNQI
ncbi:hypothetical protein [Photorhabdus hindustanensis]|uniref:Uncharacterized protein n=1 Tax=Photorhabdus hindustanensis TaxID=2918802 RepID=A0A2S8Q843_9GAMM|nr:hypothetical protein [Photorhabdus hindustanensis]PQQ29131.1 hypothetical protein C6H66_02290 [Photorhabdus hindustanensis]